MHGNARKWAQIWHFLAPRPLITFELRARRAIAKDQIRCYEYQDFHQAFRRQAVQILFKTSVRSVSEDEARELSLKYAQQNVEATLPGHALEVDLRPAFEQPLAEVQLKFASVPWESSRKPQP
jgi:hypothetical protein